MKVSQSAARTPLTRATLDTLVSATLTIESSGPGFIDLTDEIDAFLDDASATEGLVTMFCRHTSASLTIQENADPLVLADLMTTLDRLAPQNAGWRHRTEGPDDMPAHIKTMLTTTALQIPVSKGRLALGQWQAIYLIEHRTQPHRREIVMQFAGVTRQR